MSAEPNDDEAARRRELLAGVLESWFARTEDVFLSLPAAELVLSIKHESSSRPPGEPMVVTLHSGIVAQSQLSRIAALWSKVFPILRKASLAQGGEVANFFHEWVHPNHPGKGAAPEYETESRKFAKRMMTELLAAFAGVWPMHHHLRRYAETLGLQDSIYTDPIAEVLFPSRDLEDWRKANQEHAAAADKLADKWSKEDPAKLRRYSQQSSRSRARLALAASRATGRCVSDFRIQP